MNITRHLPAIVAQTQLDSCWAAVLESWSRTDSRVGHQRQADLVRRWGEGPTGGITPATKIPMISNVLGLAWGGFAGPTLGRYLTDHLPRSHVFCAYTRGAYTHAVLIYRLSERGNVSYMDPDGGHDRWHPLSWFAGRGPFVLLRKP